MASVTSRFNGKTQWVVGAFLTLLLSGFMYFAGKDRDHIAEEVKEAKAAASAASEKADKAIGFAKDNTATLASVNAKLDLIIKNVDEVKAEVRENRKVIHQ